jgi:hypothetical protein
MAQNANSARRMIGDPWVKGAQIVRFGISGGPEGRLASPGIPSARL